MSPLAKLTSNKNKFVWEKMHQDAFDKMKKTVAKEVFLSFPDWDRKEGFETFVDAADTAVGAALMQGKKTNTSKRISVITS